MNTIKTFVTLLATTSSLLAGCMASDTQAPVADNTVESVYEPQAGTGLRDPPAGSNGTLPACLWAGTTQETLRTLAQNKLNTGNNVLPSMPLISDSCRPVIDAAIKCALSKETAVEDPDTGEQLEGWWGLAPNWLKDPLSDPTERKWVTLCMLQKLNYFGVKVPILMEGAHDNLHTVPQYELELPYDESTVFGGDLFSSTVDPYDDKKPPFTFYVCSDSDLIATCGNTTNGSGWLQYRICAGAGARCGMQFLGPCSNVCNYASGYAKCYDSDGTQYPETIHVQLETFGGVCI